MTNLTQTLLYDVRDICDATYDRAIGLYPSPIGRTIHCSDDPLVLQSFGPVTHWSYSLEIFPYIPLVLYDPLV